MKTTYGKLVSFKDTSEGLIATVTAFVPRGEYSELEYSALVEEHASALGNWVDMSIGNVGNSTLSVIDSHGHIRDSEWLDNLEKSAKV